MKITFTILLAFLMLWAYADISISHTNADDQTFAIEFKAPTADPSGTVLRVELTLTTPYSFVAPNEHAGAVCTVTQDGGSFPTGVSDTFALAVACGASNLCTPSGSGAPWFVFGGSIDINTGGTLDYTFDSGQTMFPYLNRSATGAGNAGDPYIYKSAFEFTSQLVTDYHLPGLDDGIACFFSPDNRLDADLNTTRTDINSGGMFTEEFVAASSGDLANQDTSSAERFSLILTMSITSMIYLF